MNKLSQHSYFDPNIEKLVRAQLLAEFSEGRGDYDYAVCKRPDGSNYGIAAGKKCIKGTETTIEPKLKPKKKKPSEERKTTQKKKEEKSESRPQSARTSPERTALEKNISRVEIRAKEQLKKAQADIAAAKLIEDEQRRYDAKIDAEERESEAKLTLAKLELDREDLAGGAFDRPVRQFSDEQRRRIETILERMRDERVEKGGLSDVYYDLVKLKNAKDPQMMAEYLKTEKEIDKERDSVLKLPEDDPRRVKWGKEIMRNIAREELAKLTREERLAVYNTSDGMTKILDSSISSKQNAAHRDSASLFTVAHGELGDSKMAQSLIKKYKGDKREVQSAIDDIISFTQNSYVSIRRGVVDEDPTYVAQAQRINTMIDRLPHPDVAKYRGIVVNSGALESMVSAARAKQTFADPAPSSWSTSAPIASRYYAGSGQSVLFETKNKRGASVENWGQSGEKEILTPGNTSYRYTNYRTETHEGKQIHIFTVEEN